LITHYGYIDGSGEYFVVVDSDKCNGCRKCVEKCPMHALELVSEFIDLEDKIVVAVTEEHRKRIRYTCAECKPGQNVTPCVLACDSGAIACVWNPL